MMERKTHQRMAIRRVFEEIARPLGPQEVLKAAQAYAPRLGIATVYRTIKGFMEEGIIEPVEIPGEPPRYEMAGKPHHHHFFCKKCHRVFEVEGCVVKKKPNTPENFIVEGHKLLFYGKCEDCAT